MLEYVGETTAGVDGHYTLTVIMEGAQEPQEPVIDYTPEFAKELTDVTAKVGDNIEPLTVEVKAMDVDTENPLTYQWYSATKEEGLDKTPITDAKTASYTPPTTAAGTIYYVCEVTRTVDGKPYTATSNAVKVTVQAVRQTTQ